jgi:hypothetical protein
MQVSAVEEGETIPVPADANWMALVALALGVASLIIAEFLPAGMLTPMAQGLGISEGMTGQAVTATSILAVVTSLKNATNTQVALAWLLAQKPWIVPIPGTRNRRHLNDNLGLEVRLTPADLRELDTALSGFTVHGGRMNAMQMKAVDQAMCDT